MKTTTVLAVSLGLALASSSPARGMEKEDKKTTERDSWTAPVVVRSISLQPAPDNEVQLEEVDLDLMSNGERHLKIRTKPSREESVAQRVYFVVDPETETYRTVRGLLRPEDAVEKRAPLTIPTPNIAPGGDGCCDNLCNGYATGSIDTLDPVQCVLTTTTANGSWQNASRIPPQSGCRWIVSGSKSCYAASPSCAGTHWTKSSCQLIGPSGGSFFFEDTAVGNYYNYDFMNPSLRTDVYQAVTIDFNSGYVSFTFNHSDSGEGSSLIYGSYYHSEFNTCFP